MPSRRRTADLPAEIPTHHEPQLRPDADDAPAVDLPRRSPRKRAPKSDTGNRSSLGETTEDPERTALLYRIELGSGESLDATARDLDDLRRSGESLARRRLSDDDYREMLLIVWRRGEPRTTRSPGRVKGSKSSAPPRDPPEAFVSTEIRRPLASSRSSQAARDLELADPVTTRRNAPGRLRFQSVASALGWFYPARERMQAANPADIRGERMSNGEMTRISVDGGPGGDVTEVLATISTIGTALRRLARHNPQAHAIVEWTRRDGKTQAEIEELTNLAQSTISSLLARGEEFLAGCWSECEVLR